MKCICFTYCSSGVTAFSSENHLFMAMLYGIRLDIYLRKSTERIHSFNFNGSHISSVFAIMWKSQSIHRNCLSALITLHSYRSLPPSAKPSYIISGAAEQLLSSTKSVMLNDEGRMPTPFRFFYVFGLAKIFLVPFLILTTQSWSFAADHLCLSVQGSVSMWE